MIDWFKRLWSRRPMLRGSLTVHDGDTVRLKGDREVYTVVRISGAVHLDAPEKKNALAHTQVRLSFPWRSFRDQVAYVNERPVW